MRARGENRKEQWLASVAAAWRDPASRARLRARLSPQAHAAVARLARAGAAPAALFLAEHGPLRRAGPGRAWSPPPWEQPQTVAEELYYAGLLCPLDPPAIGRARRVAVPADLREILAGVPDLQPPEQGLHAPAGPERSVLLLHDAAQFLLYLSAHPPRRLLQGRWLPISALEPLNPRLLRPEQPPLRTHKRSPRLRLLFFLLLAAGLWDAGAVTPAGHAWLAAPASRRLALLWAAWRDVPLALRRAYDDLSPSLPPPWPRLLLDQIARYTAAFSAPALSEALWGSDPALAPYFAAHLPDLRTLDALIARTLARLSDDWGVLESLPDFPAYRLTPIGRWLLDGMAGEPAGLDDPAPAPSAWLDPAPPDAWRIAVSAWALPAAQAALALHAVYLHLDPHPDPPRHVYRLSADSVAAAAAAGHGLPGLLDALASFGISVPPALWADLAGWTARGHELQLATLPLLRAASPEVMGRVFGAPDARPALGELIAPTVALLALPPDEAARHLAAAGFYPDQTRLPSTTAGEAPAGSSGALWLAGQLYAALRNHLDLPLPPPFPALQVLLADLPPAQQAALQAQWETLHTRLLALLDGQAFTPPPEPSDPSRWRTRIEGAIAEGRLLEIAYFTAGRNLLTHRTVTPLWIEEHRGVPYLRADCHLAGRIRLFRLDRIAEMNSA
jgi:hypothetical protein